MNKGKEGLGFVAESSKKEGLGFVADPQRRRRKTRRRSLLLLPLLMLLLTFVIQRRSGRSLRARIRSRILESRPCHLSWSLRPPKPESLDLLTITL
jgi:hypothetical protein